MARPRVGGNQFNWARGKAMLALYLERGWPLAMIGRRYHLSRERVSRILMRFPSYGARRKENPEYNTARRVARAT